jgi:hypothetical protein
MKNFRNQQPQCVLNQEDKENAGAKESRLQELYEFPESAPTSWLQLLST